MLVRRTGDLEPLASEARGNFLELETCAAKPGICHVVAKVGAKPWSGMSTLSKQQHRATHLGGITVVWFMGLLYAHSAAYPSLPSLWPNPAYSLRLRIS